MKKRILSMLLVLVMMFSTLPATALAVEGEGETGTEVTAYTPAEGDVIYIPGTPAKEGKISKGYVLNSATPDELVEIVIPNTVAETIYTKAHGARLWMIVDGKLTRAKGVWEDNDAMKYKFGYHDTLTYTAPVEADEAAGTEAVAASITLAHAKNHTGTLGSSSGGTCAWEFDNNACGQTTSNRYQEAPATLAIADDVVIIDRTTKAAYTGTKATTVEAVAKLCEDGQAIVNTYVADGAKGSGTVSAIIAIDPQDDFVPTVVLEVGEVVYFPKFKNWQTYSCYVLKSDRMEAGTEIKVYTKLSANPKNNGVGAGHFLLIDADGKQRVPDYYYYHTLTGLKTGYRYKFALHEAIASYTAAVEADEANGIAAAPATIKLKSAAGHDVAKECALGWTGAGCTGGSDRASEIKTSTALTITEDTLVLDLRTSGTKVTTVEQVKALTDMGAAVVNVYSADGASSSGTATAIIVLDPSTGFKAPVELQAGDVVYVPGYIKAANTVGAGYILNSANPTELVNVYATEAFPWNSDASSWSKRAYGASFWLISETGKPQQVQGYYNNKTVMAPYTYAMHDTITGYTAPVAADEEAGIAAAPAYINLAHAANHIGADAKCAYNWAYACGVSDGHRGYEFAEKTALSENCVVIDARTLAEGETAVTDVAGLVALADSNAVVVNMWGAEANVADVIILLETGAEKFDITVGEVENGTVKVNKTKATAGEKVTVTATPAAGYNLEAIYVDGVAIATKSFTVTGDHVVTAAFAQVKDLADGDVIFVPGEVRYPGRASTGYVVKSSVLPVGTEVSVDLIDKEVGATYARLYYTGRFWTANVKTTTTETTDETTGEVTTTETTTVTYAPDKDIWQTPKGTLGVHDAFVSYDAETNTMVIDDAAGHQFQNDCAYRYGQTTDGNKETCGAIDRENDSWEPSSVTLAADLYVLDTRTLAEGETAVATIADIQALAANNQVVMNVYCANAGEASFIVVLEASPLYDVTIDAVENGTVKLSYESLGLGLLDEMKVPAKTRISIVATPAEGYVVDKYVIDGKNQINGFFTTTGAHTVSATFRLPAITVGTVENGTVTVDKAEAAIGETVTITATAAEGYELESILVDGATIEGNTFVITGDHKVTATFKAIVVEPTKYAITVNEAVNGTVTVDKTEAEAGEIVTITATPAEGYKVAEIKVDGSVIEGNTFTVTGAHTVEVNFAAIVVEPETVTVTVIPVENGTVTVDKTEVAAGETITITLIPDEGYMASGVQVSNCEGVPTRVDDCTYTAVATGKFAIEISGHFVAKPVAPTVYDITVEERADGTITVDKAAAEAGETVTITATPAEGNRLMGIFVDGTAITGNTFTVTGAHTVTAQFKPLLNFATTSANVGDVLDLNFRMTVTDVDFEGGYAILTGPMGEQRVDRADWQLSVNGAIQRYNITYKGMLATMMSEEVTAVVYDDNGNQMSAPASGSIRDYCMRALDSYSSNPKYEKMCVLLVDMLVYGSTAQQNLPNAPTDLADALLTDEQRAWATTAPKAYASTVEKSHTGNGTSATLGSRIELNFTFLKSDVPNAASAKITFNHAQSTLGAAEVTIPVSKFAESGSTKWKIVLNELVAADGRQPVRCEILDADGNVLAWSVDTVTGYVANLVAKYPSYKWAEAMVVFCDSAYAWFCH